MKHIIKLSLFLMFIFLSCKKKSEELKYKEHNTYSEFLNYLKREIGKASNEYEKTKLIRMKVAELVDAGVGGNDISLLEEDWINLPASRYYSIFYYDSATVKCGGAAHFLNKVYLDLGYNSELYDIGIDNNVLTHQMTLVFVDDLKYCYIQDAFFNISFLDSNDVAIRFEKMMSLIYKDKYSTINVKQDDYSFSPRWDWTGIDKIEKSKVKKLKRDYKSLRSYSFFSSVYKQMKKDTSANLLILYKSPLKHNSKIVFNIINEIEKKFKPKKHEGI